MTTLIRKWCLKRLLTKSKRRTIPLGDRRALSNDDFEIRIENIERTPRRSYLVTGLEGDELTVVFYDGTDLHEDRLKFSPQLNPRPLGV